MTKPRRPLLAIAHRAGNRIADAAAACAWRPDFIEADLHLRRGRVEVRHLKTMGPVPVLWDRWKLAPGWTPRLTLGELVEGIRDILPSQTQLLLDLKGRDLRLSARTAQVMSQHAPGMPFAVCSRFWGLVDPFVGSDGVTVFHSAGSIAQVQEIPEHLARFPTKGNISVDRLVLNDQMAKSLRKSARTIVSWHVATPAEVAQVEDWRFDGVTSDNTALLRAIVKRRTAASD